MYENLGRKWHIMLYNTLKTSRPDGIWKICCWIHIPAWICCSCIVFHKAPVFDGLLQYAQCVPYAAIVEIFPMFWMIWYCRVQSPAVFKRQHVRWCSFADRFRYPLAVFGIRVLIGLSRLLLAHIAYEIDTSKIIAEFWWISYCLYDLIRLNSIACRVQTTGYTMI